MTVRPPADWRPDADLDVLRLRAKVLHAVRRFFAARDVLEVDTPILSHTAATDPNIDSFTTEFTGPGFGAAQPLYLHTSPEFAMKRLLAAGSGPIYQICKVFRQCELGALHNPEFTLLEWYRPGFNQYALMAEIEALTVELLTPGYSLQPTEHISYRRAFLDVLDVDPFEADSACLQQSAAQHGVQMEGPATKQQWLDLLMSQCVQPRLGRGRLTFLVDYPADQAALARINRDNSQVAERFELFFNGLELANGFCELTDAEEQRRRFREALRPRGERGQYLYPPDQRLIAALAQGMPDCSGVAMGLDRLILIISGKKKLKDVLSFSFESA